MKCANVNFNWNLRENVAEGTTSDAIGQLSLRVFEDNPACGVRWQMSFQNNSPEILEEVAAFNCFSLDKAPLFRDLDMVRTKVRSANGDWVALNSVPKVPGPRTIQFYAVNGGISQAEHPWLRDFKLTSEIVLSGDRITVESTDGKWLLENIVDGPVAFFFNNWEPRAGCIHVAPLYGSVAPGEVVTTQGIINISHQK